MEQNKDQSGAVASEKPQFPWNPDPINHEWTQPEIAAIHAFGEGCFQAGVSSVQSGAAVRGEAVADDMLQTWPENIWLQGGKDEVEEYPGMSEDLTWCSESIHSSDVHYVRADLATVSARAADAPSEPSELVLAFGKGLIEVGQGHHGNERKPAILFGRNGAGAVGIETEGDRVMLPGECIAALTFDNPESLDVVAEKFSELRARIWPKSRAADALDSQPTELPPLPESDWTLAGSANNRDAYTADQMREYGRLCASSQPTDGGVQS